MCHMSCVTCHILVFVFDKVVKLVGGGSVINGATLFSLYSSLQTRAVEGHYASNTTLSNLVQM